MLLQFIFEGETFSLIFPDKMDPISKEIKKTGTFYEIKTLQAVRAEYIYGGVFLDVGANVGNHTIFFSKICGAQVLAFEPNPIVREMLTQNITRNGVVSLVKVFPYALGNKETKGKMVPATHIPGMHVAETDTGSIEIKRLDDLPEIRELDRLNLIKIDVEGTEVSVLEGAVGTLRKYKPILYIEALRPPAWRILEEYLETQGYRCTAKMNGRNYRFTPQ